VADNIPLETKYEGK